MALSKRNQLIVLIDDDMPDNYPLLRYLKDDYGEDKVELFRKPADGIKFIEDNLSQRIIVLLDIMFDGVAVGIDVFKHILDKSSLVCFIVMSGNIEITPWHSLVDLINGHAWYIIRRDAPAKEIRALVKKAKQHLSTQVDVALEEWILRQSAEKQQKGFLKNRSGQSYSLLDILRAIRTGDDEIGNQMVTSILTTAIDILNRGESKNE